MDNAERLIDLGGVRTEDNVLITHDGHFNITMAAGVAKKAADIEDYIASTR